MTIEGIRNEPLKIDQSATFSVFKAKVLVPSNDPEFRDGEFLGSEFPLSVEMKIHPNNSGRIIINVPGLGGDIDGYNNKYGALANEMQREGLGSVVRTHGNSFAGYLPDTQVRLALELAISNAQAICGSQTPEIYLMGFSAGAGGIAAVAYEYPEVKKILLVAPSFDMPKDEVKTGLQKFKGEVVIVQGEEDDVVGPETGPECFQFATGASKKGIFMIPGCDHQFRGTENGQVMAKAPFYAFAEEGGKPSFPSPEGGLVLY